MHIYKYMYINVPFYLQMSENITQQPDILRYSYISILTNLLPTEQSRIHTNLFNNLFTD